MCATGGGYDCTPASYPLFSTAAAFACESSGGWPVSHFVLPMFATLATRRPLLVFLVTGLWEVAELLLRSGSEADGFQSPSGEAEGLSSYESPAGSLVYDWVVQGGWGVLVGWLAGRAFGVARAVAPVPCWSPARRSKVAAEAGSRGTSGWGWGWLVLSLWCAASLWLTLGEGVGVPLMLASHAVLAVAFVLLARPQWEGGLLLLALWGVEGLLAAAAVAPEEATRHKCIFGVQGFATAALLAGALASLAA